MRVTEGIAIVRDVALFAWAGYTMRRGFDISDTRGLQVVKLPDAKGLIVNFQFGKTFRDSKEAGVVLAAAEHPAICAIAAVTAYISAAQRLYWDLSGGHLFPTVGEDSPDGEKGELPLSAAQMTAAL